MHNVSNTPPTPLLHRSSFPNSSEVIFNLLLLYKLFLIWCHRKWTGMSGGVFASHSLSLFLFSPSCVTLSHSHLLQPFFSRPLSHISVSFCFFYLLCPPLALPGSFSDVFPPTFFSYSVHIIPQSFKPLHFSFKHLLSFSHAYTHTSPQSNESGSSPPPPPPTYHRVYCICHHVLLA